MSRVSVPVSNVIAKVARGAIRAGSTFDNEFPAAEDWQRGRGSMRSWFESLEGFSFVDTVQVQVSQDWQVVNGWAPGPRRVTRFKAGGVELDGSFLEYDGTIVHLSSKSLVVVSDWGENYLVRLYRAC